MIEVKVEDEVTQIFEKIPVTLEKNLNANITVILNEYLLETALEATPVKSGYLKSEGHGVKLGFMDDSAGANSSLDSFTSEGYRTGIVAGSVFFSGQGNPGRYGYWKSRDLDYALAAETYEEGSSPWFLTNATIAFATGFDELWKEEVARIIMESFK